MFGRKARLSLYSKGQENKPKVYTELDIRFSVRNNSGFIEDASIDVCNPSRDFMDAFAATVPTYRESAERRRVRLEIGWADEKGLVCIFDGYVKNAMPTSYPPNVWFSMRCIGMAFADVTIPTSDGARIRFNSAGDAPLTFGKVLQESEKCLKSVGLDLVSEVTDKDLLATKLTSGFESGNKLREFLMQIKLVSKNLSVYTFGNSVHVVDRRERGGVAATVNKDTGMIGIPRGNYPNYYVETFLNTRIHLWDVVKVESSFKLFYRKGEKDGEAGSMEKSGLFRVNGISYTGQLRSGKWSMTLDLCQISEAVKDLDLEAKKNAAKADVKVG